jgi:hypothetical protein
MGIDWAVCEKVVRGKRVRELASARVSNYRGVHLLRVAWLRAAVDYARAQNLALMSETLASWVHLRERKDAEQDEDDSEIKRGNINLEAVDTDTLEPAAQSVMFGLVHFLLTVGQCDTCVSPGDAHQMWLAYQELRPFMPEDDVTWMDDFMPLCLLAFEKQMLLVQH